VPSSKSSGSSTSRSRPSLAGFSRWQGEMLCGCWHSPSASRQLPFLAKSRCDGIVTCRPALADAEPVERDFAPVGIDLGLISLVALSTGETVATPQHTRLASKRQRRLQRALSRCKRSSNRRRKAKVRLARHSAKTANQRRDFSHKLSASLVARFSHIAMEDLNIKGLVAGMLAKSVHNAAWRQLVQHIS
jgi:putative transposase